MKLIGLILFCILAFLLMVGALYFSKYKKRKSVCCSDSGTCAESSAKTCDEDNNKTCVCDSPAQ